jgi:alpha/beta superfamily hydrolase
VVQGDADDLVSVAEVSAWVAGLEPAPELVVLPGVDHYFHGRLHELQNTVVARLG